VTSTRHAGGLSKRVSPGEYFDVVVIRRWNWGPVLGNKVIESSAKALARAGIGVAVSRARQSRHSSVDAFKKALLAARAIAYVDPASGGSSASIWPSCSRRWESPSNSSPRPCW